MTVRQLVTIQPGMLGADYVWLSPRVKEWLLTNKARFVVRYIARRTSINKIITRQEIAWLHGHNIAIVLNYEGSAGDILSGAAGGVANGAWSRRFVEDLGYPAGAPLTFSADTDVWAGNLGTATAYSRGFIGQIGQYLPAAYADSDLLAALKPLRPYGWLPNARSWSEESDGAVVHIKQGREDKQWGVDPNVCVLPFPAWLPHDGFNPPTPTPPKDDDDMGKLFTPDDGDPAEFVVAGGAAVWVRDPEHRRALQGIAGLCERGPANECPRAFLRNLALVGPEPQYPADYTGPRTTRADFGG